MTAKEELQEVLDDMPDDASMEALLAEMSIRASLMRAVAQIDRGETLSHEEVKERLYAWLESGGRQKLSRI